GLSAAEAVKRLAEYGPNELTEKKKKTPFMMILDQFKDFMIMVLIAAAVIAGIVGKPTDAAAIIAIVILNAIIGFIQEYRAEEAMAALKKMAAPSSTVLRDGLPATVAASEIVPGDIILLEAGQIVPADLRLSESANLKIEEAALTGESVPVEKHIALLHDEHLPIGDRKNMTYQGTIVTYGRGTGVVTATGMGTEMGKIATMLQEEKDLKTPLQQRLTVFGKKLAVAIMVICAIVFVAGMMRGEPAVLMLLTAISLAVAAIPEALPAVITIALAIGAKKMVKLNALIRRLPAVETLGSVTYICTDKTGTLTLNKMTVEEMYVDGKISGVRDLGLGIKTAGIGDQGLGVSKEELIPSPQPPIPVFTSPQNLLFTALALSNDAQMDAGGNIIGDPTEIALYNIAKENGFDKKELEKGLPRVAEIPFDSDRKCMTTFHKISPHPNPLPQPKVGALSRERETQNPPPLRGGDTREGEFKYISFTKGGVDVLLEKADNILTSEGLKPLDMQELHKINDRMAADGLRVLCIALRSWDSLPADMSPENVEKGLSIIGLTGMMDPPREEAKEAVKLCKMAGIKPVMITGDHPITAKVIAGRLGLLEDAGIGDGRAVITGRELDKLSLEEFEERVEHIRVYARVAPEQKLKIVEALQDKGQFVAMTGDGVNDAPALKRSNIGVAMGITGTGVAKEASSMILLDDNFATIVRAIKEGRRIYDNILRFVNYSMTSNAGTLWAIFLAPFFGLPLPLVPIQILWMNLLTDSLPGLALTAEPAERNIMGRPPRHPEEGVFSNGRGLFIIKFGLVIGISALLFQAFAVKEGMPWQTMVFTALVIGRMAVVMSVRSEKDSIFTIGFFSNRPLLGAIVLTVALQMAVVYMPFLNPIFNTQPLTLNELLLTLALSSVVFIAVEIEKIIKRRSNRQKAVAA
ncbi:MAG: cation-translocating P-type ATPase, partial [Nitrospirota bacterium]|nr:cation-translocating P-type ATPase [Nitrospirota bacterium]